MIIITKSNQQYEYFILFDIQKPLDGIKDMQFSVAMSTGDADCTDVTCIHKY